MLACDMFCQCPEWHLVLDYEWEELLCCSERITLKISSPYMHIQHFLICYF